MEDGGWRMGRRLKWLIVVVECSLYFLSVILGSYSYGINHSDIQSCEGDVR